MKHSMKIIAVTQARYGSTRLPAKVLKEVNGETLLETHLKRILKSDMITGLVVATTTEDGSDKIVKIAEKLNLPSYRGSVNDVLDRFFQAVVNEKPDYVVRITSDCPLIDSKIIDEVIRLGIDSDCDYISNTLDPTYPDGMDCECFKFSALEKAWKEATLKSDREHVTPYIWRNSSYKGGNLFKSICKKNDRDLSSIRMTVDNIEDFEVIKALIDALGTDKSCKEYVEYLNNHKELANLNSSYKRNEGYAKSLLND